jgi:hypothetical protein
MKLALFILLSLTVSSFAKYTCADDFTTKDTCKAPCNWFDAATCTDNCAP